LREQVKEIWRIVYQGATDAASKDRAKGYVTRLDMFDYLESAAKEYEARFGNYPVQLDDLVAKGILTELPQDPFGFTFKINSSTGAVGIDTTNEPGVITD
jgi:hypothetical protein